MEGRDGVKEKLSKRTFKDYFVLTIGILAVVIVMARAVIYLSPDDTSNQTDSLYPDKVGIEPYRYNEHEWDLLDFLDRQNTILLKVKAPKEARYLSFHIHTLQEDGTWETSLVSEEDLEGYFVWEKPILTQEDMDEYLAYRQRVVENEIMLPFEGTFFFLRNSDDSIKIDLKLGKQMRGFQVDIPAPVIAFDERMGISGFLHEFQTIELGEEIPVAFLVLNDELVLSDEDKMPSVTLSEYYDTSELTEYSFVQFVTMTFSAEKTS